MNLNYKYLPTPLAQRAATHVGLLPAQTDPMYQEALTKLIQFEQVAMSGTYVAAEQAYMFEKLNKKQTKILRAIFDLSKHWIKAHTVGKLLEVMDGEDKAAVAAAQLLLGVLVPEGEEAETESSKLVINVTQKG